MGSNDRRFMSRLGFGLRTEPIYRKASLRGAALAGLEEKRRFKRPEQQKWYAGETISVGIGQGYNAHTPLQLAHATATLAAGGMSSHTWSAMSKTSGSGERRMIEPCAGNEPGLKPEHLAEIRRAMIGGTRRHRPARLRRGPIWLPARRSTAQVYSLRGGRQVRPAKVRERLRDHSPYIAYAPAEAPAKIALAVLVENGGFGASRLRHRSRARFSTITCSANAPETGPRGCRCARRRGNPMRQERP